MEVSLESEVLCWGPFYARKCGISHSRRNKRFLLPTVALIWYCDYFIFRLNISFTQGFLVWKQILSNCLCKNFIYMEWQKSSNARITKVCGLGEIHTSKYTFRLGMAVGQVCVLANPNPHLTDVYPVPNPTQPVGCHQTQPVRGMGRVVFDTVNFFILKVKKKFPIILSFHLFFFFFLEW